MATDREREEQARRAGAVLYNSFSGTHSRPSTTGTTPQEVPYGLYNLRAFSAIRRTFCLFVLFDLVLVLIIWVIYVQLKHDPNATDLFPKLRKEVEQYNIRTSLFDMVLAASCRFVILILSYALFKSRTPLFIALTTLACSTFYIAKPFVYEPQADAHDVTKSVEYALIIVSFILCWLETWLLDFRVLPLEEKEMRRRGAKPLADVNTESGMSANGTMAAGERAPLLVPPGPHSGFYTPQAPLSRSPHSASDDGGFLSVRASQATSRAGSFASLIDEDEGFTFKGRQCFDKAWTLINQDNLKWKVETGKDLVSGIVYSLHTKDYGKIFKLKGQLDIDPQVMFHDLIENCVDSPRWNPAILKIQILQRIDTTTDICYSVAAEGAKGLVSSRDFVVVRHWRKLTDWSAVANMSVTHPAAPPDRSYVRGEQKPGCVRFRRATADEGGGCLMEWLLCTDLKGWLPQYLIDQALSGVLITYLKHMRTHCEELKASS